MSFLDMDLDHIQRGVCLLLKQRNVVEFFILSRYKRILLRPLGDWHTV